MDNGLLDSTLKMPPQERVAFAELILASKSWGRRCKKIMDIGSKKKGRRSKSREGRAFRFWKAVYWGL